MASGVVASSIELTAHNALVVIEFDEEVRALKFEKNLKTGSGREFARRQRTAISRVNLPTLGLLLFLTGA